MPAARPARRTAPAPGDGGSRCARLPGSFEHFYLEDLSTRQIARLLDCAEGTVRAHLAKARRTLARRLHLDAWEAP